MIHIFDIAQKDLLQVLRDRKVFIFTLVMPIAFTLLFGYAFSGGASDPRLPVAYLDADQSRLSKQLHELLSASDVIRLEEYPASRLDEIEIQVAQEKLAAVILVPRGYGHTVLNGKPARLTLVADDASPAGITVKSAVLSAANRLDSAVHTALIMEQLARHQAPFDYAFRQALSAWQEPPIQVHEILSQAAAEQEEQNSELAHTSPGMMMQFAVAGLLASAQIIVNERKSRALQRLFTTAVKRVHVLLGHYLAILSISCTQFLLLIGFGQLALKVNYMYSPSATLLVAFCAAVCLSALGLLIGALAKDEEQAVIFSLVLMFLFAGLGGAWVPLEVAGPAFQFVGHLTPLAWAMDGLENVLLRGLGLQAAMLPAAALLGYAVLFFGLAVWRFQAAQG